MFRVRDVQLAALRKQTTIDQIGRDLEPGWRVAKTESGDALIVDPDGRTTRLEFDQNGAVATRTGPEGRTYRFENEPDGDVRTLSHPSGLSFERELDDLGRVCSISRNGRELASFAYLGDSTVIRQARYPDHTTLEIEYDDQGRMAAVTDRLGNRSRAEYRNDGELSAIVDANGNSTRFRFDKPTGILELVHPDGCACGREYDEAGRIVRLFAAGETTAHLEYDDNNLLVRTRYVDGSELTYEYLDGKWPISSRGPAGSIRFHRDSRGRILGEEQEGQAVSFSYDDRGRQVALTYPGGDRVHFRYDGEDRLAEVVDWNGGKHAFAHTPDDRRCERTSPSGLRVITELTDAGLPIAQIALPPNGTGNALFAVRCTYDDADRLTTVTDNQFGTLEIAYDAEGQIRSVRSGRRGRSEAFLYDPAGNWKTANGETVRCNAANQLLQRGSRQFTYDARGNLATASEPQGVWRFTYDLRNLLVHAEGPGGREVKFGYDSLGRRLWKRALGREVRYVWAGDRLLREIERDHFRTTTRDYLYAPGSYTPLALRIDGHVYCYHTDHLGTPHRLTDEHNQIVWLADHSAFGEARIEMELIRNDLRLPGQQFDPETGLHYNRHRYYSPFLGRYLSRDPLGFEAGPHLYAYVGNRTTQVVDPLGLTPEKKISAPQEPIRDTSLDKKFEIKVEHNERRKPLQGKVATGGGHGKNNTERKKEDTPQETPPPPPFFVPPSIPDAAKTFLKGDTYFKDRTPHDPTDPDARKKGILLEFPRTGWEGFFPGNAPGTKPIGPNCSNFPNLRRGGGPQIPLMNRPDGFQPQGFTDPTQLKPGDLVEMTNSQGTALHWAYYEGTDAAGDQLFSQLDGISDVQIVTMQNLILHGNVTFYHQKS
jgi:RHS repeat-associated protein